MCEGLNPERFRKPAPQPLESSGVDSVSNLLIRSLMLQPSHVLSNLAQQSLSGFLLECGV
ncbi:hypothetical protein SAMN04487967_3009 [Natronorubrum sediminis]|uniref:Uncharacterized protein n=1 Tax=Natronorubrum sediminis TaxID=640943 RepID=A0A1H6G3H5_9EURY|nr:hypothetical protein SAMN04487967_3009 [Natronorubrum sediminis]